MIVIIELYHKKTQRFKISYIGLSVQYAYMRKSN